MCSGSGMDAKAVQLSMYSIQQQWDQNWGERLKKSTRDFSTRGQN